MFVRPSHRYELSPYTAMMKTKMLKIGASGNSARTFFLLTLDDLLLRKEWGENIQVSAKELDPEADLEVVDLCSDLGLRATLFIPAVVAGMFPEIIRGLSKKNFEIAAHGYRHENLRMPFFKQRHLIALSMNSIRGVVSEDVKGWRSPELYVDNGTLRAIEQSKIQWCSNMVLPLSVRHFPFRSLGGGKVEIPIMSSIDYFMYRKGFTPYKVLGRWLKDLDVVYTRRSKEVFTLLVHPWIQVGRRERIKVLKTFLEKVQSIDDICCLRCSEVIEFSNSTDNAFYRTFLKTATKIQATAMKRQRIWRFFQRVFGYIA